MRDDEEKKDPSRYRSVQFFSSEQARLAALADRVFPAFANYRRDADKIGREIPIVQLTPR